MLTGNCYTHIYTAVCAATWVTQVPHTSTESHGLTITHTLLLAACSGAPDPRADALRTLGAEAALFPHPEAVALVLGAMLEPGLSLCALPPSRHLLLPTHR